MNQTEISMDSDQHTQIIASELKLTPTDNVYRYLHPIMICGVEDGKLLLRGTKSNGTAVIDNYRPQKDRVSASSLTDAGLNFTTTFHPNYKSDQRRLAVSFKMKDQPKGLRIYPDVGSEVPSVYFTVPEDSFFKVDFKDGDPIEVGIAIKLHQLMGSLHLADEPEYLNWMESSEGARVVSYLKQENEKEQRIEVAFLKEGNSYKIDSALDSVDFLTREEKKLLEAMAIYRLLLEDRDFDEIVGLDNIRYKREDLVVSITKSSEFKSLQNF